LLAFLAGLAGELAFCVLCYILLFEAVFVVLCKHKHVKCAHEPVISIFFDGQPHIGIGDSDDQLGCSFHDGFEVLGRTIVSELSLVRLAAHQENVLLLTLALGTRKLWKPRGSICIVFLFL
jgi:hypothetical protein